MKMNQQLLKTLALGLMAMVGINAWADDANVTMYQSDGTTKVGDYASLKAAVDAKESEIQVLQANYILVVNASHESGRCSNIPTGVKVKVKSGENVTVTCGDPAFFNNLAGTIEVDGSDGTLTFNANQKNGSFFQAADGKTATFKNVTFKNSKNGTYDASAGNDYSVIDFTGTGTVTLDNVTFDAVASHAIGFRKTNGGGILTIQNGITFSSCTWDGEVTYKGAIYFKTAPSSITIADATHVHLWQVLRCRLRLNLT